MKTSLACINGHAVTSRAFVFTSTRELKANAIRVMDLGHSIKPRFWLLFRDVFATVFTEEVTESGSAGQFFAWVRSLCPDNTAVVQIAFLESGQVHTHQLITPSALETFVSVDSHVSLPEFRRWYDGIEARYLRPQNPPCDSHIDATALFNGRVRRDSDGALYVIEQEEALDGLNASTGLESGFLEDMNYNEDDDCAPLPSLTTRHWRS